MAAQADETVRHLDVVKSSVRIDQSGWLATDLRIERRCVATCRERALRFGHVRPLARTAYELEPGVRLGVDRFATRPIARSLRHEVIETSAALRLATRARNEVAALSRKTPARVIVVRLLAVKHQVATATFAGTSAGRRMLVGVVLRAVELDHCRIRSRSIHAQPDAMCHLEAVLSSRRRFLEKSPPHGSRSRRRELAAQLWTKHRRGERIPLERQFAESESERCPLTSRASCDKSLHRETSRVSNSDLRTPHARMTVSVTATRCRPFESSRSRLGVHLRFVNCSASPTTGSGDGKKPWLSSPSSPS